MLFQYPNSSSFSADLSRFSSSDMPLYPKGISMVFPSLFWQTIFGLYVSCDGGIPALNPTILRRFEGFEHISDQEAWSIIASLEAYSKLLVKTSSHPKNNTHGTSTRTIRKGKEKGKQISQ